ncbi:ArsR family transcriptional regulator [mine drainage metagenome]|uniref:ArsR family transcriptional regulator n=1 Tax=mine drainage metagenome TaxID=410659 RepID=T1B206_9ZZZZ
MIYRKCHVKHVAEASRLCPSCEIAAALAHPHRLELLELIAQGERSVEELAERTGLSVANASRHLQILRRARLASPAARASGCSTA